MGHIEWLLEGPPRARRGTQPYDNLSHTCERSSTCQTKHKLILCYGTRQNPAVITKP